MAILKRGLAGEPVRRLQAKLGVPVDGEFGPNTEAALKNWQTDKGLSADGIAGPDTFMAMGLYELILLKQGTRGDTVKALQQKLGVGADGQFGPGTEKAVREYQKKNGLTADGVAGPATLAHMKLFPGSHRRRPSRPRRCRHRRSLTSRARPRTSPPTPQPACAASGTRSRACSSRVIWRDVGDPSFDGLSTKVEDAASVRRAPW